MLEVILGDLTKMDADAIVNSANSALLSGAGVSGAIHKAAGPELEKEGLQHAPLAEGNSIITKGYDLKAKYVVHTVAPKYYLKQENREELLRSSYYTSLKIADENKVKTIAYPAIGIGIFKWPVDLALTIAVEEVSKYLQNENKNIEKVIFVVMDEELKETYESIIAKYS